MLTLEVDEDTVLAVVRLALSDHNRGVHLLSQVRLALLHCRHHEAADTGRRETVHSSG